MKRNIVIALCLLSLEGLAQKKAKYEFPDAMSETIRADYTKICDKGQVLYNINCAKCHNITVKKKELIPDFTQEQLKGYELRVLNPKHEDALPETNITPEELGLICTFLLYKQKNPPEKK